MALLPTGSNKILEIYTEEVNIVVKAKKNWTGVTLDRSSSVVVEGRYIKLIQMSSIGEREEYNSADYSSYAISVTPLFFEQTDYEIVVSSNTGEEVFLWNENYNIREKIGPVIEGNKTLISGVINFDNMVGYSDFEISLGERKIVTFRIEVFPTKISYKEDYQNMINDISDMVCEAAIDFMQKTYQMFSLSDTKGSTLSVYFSILSTIFNDYMNAVNRIMSVPHHKLITEHVVVPEYKAKRTDRVSEKWLIKHQSNVEISDGNMNVSRILAARKQITYDTAENRFVKFILKSTIKKLDEFVSRYKKNVRQVEANVIDSAEDMMRSVRRVLNSTFLQDVNEYSASQSMSLVFGMAPGYRELYKCYLMLQRGLSVNGDVFRMSPKDTAQLYEYWCFIKLFSLLKKEYELQTPDIIRVNNNGITVTLVKDSKSEARFFDPKTGDVITLTYNPGESKTQTVNQRPDNVLELEKKGASVPFKYVFDAKYKIENDPSSPFYPDENNLPGPKVDDINTMHRYRDSIVYANKKSKFTFEKTMFGAYILFPYDDEEEYKRHHFYRSIESVNIGGLPFLPGSTMLVQKLLSELISDSKESAFERTTLPRGIEEKLAAVDWSKRDVLIGTFRSAEQFKICFDKKFYYVPEKLIKHERLPIHYVALYQTDRKFNSNGEIRYYGEVIGLSKVYRKSIKEVPVNPARNNGDEIYYRITVKDWIDITESNESGHPIKPKESGFVVDFTNMFLLEHSEIVPELQFKSEAEFRFYAELKRAALKAEISEGQDNIGFDHGDSKFIFDSGEIVAIREDSIVERIKIEDFSRKPAQMFRLLQYAIGFKG